MNNNLFCGAFISVPKCASKTILKMFQLGKNRDNHLDEKQNTFIIYENHQRLKILEQKYNLENKFIFTFVRHPYNRIKSWYDYHKNLEPYKSKSLNEWIKDGCKTHWKIQNETNWEKDGISPLLQYNFIEGNKSIDFIGKMENFNEDCRLLISKLNKIFEDNKIKKRINFKNLKINKSKKSNEILNEESKKIIYKLFKKDFDYFNFIK